ncbi:MAG: hypothetical protein Kow0054_31680 [Deferrisoma sp.]
MKKIQKRSNGLIAVSFPFRGSLGGSNMDPAPGFVKARAAVPGGCRLTRPVSGATLSYL